MFLFAGFGKVTGINMHVEAFNHLGLPQWFRVVTGIVELAGAARIHPVNRIGGPVKILQQRSAA